MFCSIFIKTNCLLFTMYAFIDYTWSIFVIYLLPMLANDPSSFKLERVYEQSALENLERTAHLLFLAEGQLTLLSGVSIRFGGFHYLILSWVRSVTRNGTDASSIYAEAPAYICYQREPWNITTAFVHCRWQSMVEGKHIIPLSLCCATWHPMTTTIHHWWTGNIYSIVTVLGDLAPGDSHPSYTTMQTIDGGHRRYRVVWHNQAAWTYLCAKQTVAYAKKWYGCARVVFGGYGRRSQCIRCKALSIFHNIQSILLIENTLKCPSLNKGSTSRGTQQIMVRFIALASHLNPLVEMCSMHQRVVTGWLSWRHWASQMRMVVGYDKTFSQWWLSWRSRETHFYYQWRESKTSHTRNAETWPRVVHWDL